MRQIAAIPLALALSVTPALAEEEGSTLMERGAKLFFEGLMKEAEPMVKDLQGLMEEMEPQVRDFVQQMGPALADLMDEIGDLSAYHPPEIMPNGDIILRKKTPEEMAEEPGADGEIEL